MRGWCRCSLASLWLAVYNTTLVQRAGLVGRKCLKTQVNYARINRRTKTGGSTYLVPWPVNEAHILHRHACTSIHGLVQRTGDTSSSILCTMTTFTKCWERTSKPINERTLSLFSLSFVVVCACARARACVGLFVACRLLVCAASPACRVGVVWCTPYVSCSVAIIGAPARHFCTYFDNT